MNGPFSIPTSGSSARAADSINRDPSPYVHYLVKEAGGLLDSKDVQSWRLLNAPPKQYTRERFDDTYQWTREWGLVNPGATYETIVDNRAWQ